MIEGTMRVMDKIRGELARTALLDKLPHKGREVK